MTVPCFTFEFLTEAPVEKRPRSPEDEADCPPSKKKSDVSPKKKSTDVQGKNVAKRFKAS